MFLELMVFLPAIGLYEFNNCHRCGIALAVLGVGNAGVAAVPALKPGTELADELLYRDERKMLAEIADHSDLLVLVGPGPLSLVHQLVDKVFHFLRLVLGRGNTLMQNQASQHGLEKSPSLIAVPAQYASGLSVLHSTVLDSNA